MSKLRFANLVLTGGSAACYAEKLCLSAQQGAKPLPSPRSPHNLDSRQKELGVPGGRVCGKTLRSFVPCKGTI